MPIIRTGARHESLVPDMNKKNICVGVINGLLMSSQFLKLNGASHDCQSSELVPDVYFLHVFPFPFTRYSRLSMVPDMNANRQHLCQT